MPSMHIINVDQPSQQEVLEHVVRAGLYGRELRINGYPVLPHQVQVICGLVAHMWPAWYQRVVDAVDYVPVDPDEEVS